MTHGAVRWKTVTCSVSGWIAGTNWMADAPVPMTATRLPFGDHEWSQREEWNVSPANDDSPLMSGYAGSGSGPVAVTRTPAVISPAVVLSDQC